MEIKFKRKISFGLDEKTYRRINEVLLKKQEKYENKNHFIRCAVLNKLTEEGV